MRSNNKGFIATGLVSLFVYLGLVLIIILFFFIFKLGLGETTVEIRGLVSDSDSEYVFLNYLRTPIKVSINEEEEQLIFADLITRYYQSQDTPMAGEFQKLLIEKTQEFFGDKHPHLTWKLIVSDKRLREFDTSITVASGLTTSRLTEEKTLVDELSIVCTTLPNPNLNYPIKVELVLFNEASDGFGRYDYQALKIGEFHC